MKYISSRSTVGNEIERNQYPPGFTAKYSWCTFPVFDRIAETQNTPWCSLETPTAYGRVFGARAISAFKRKSTSRLSPARNLRCRCAATTSFTTGSTCRAYTSSKSSYSTFSIVSGEPRARLAVCPTPGFLPSKMSKCTNTSALNLSVRESCVTPLLDGRSTTSPISRPCKNLTAPWNETFWKRGWSMFLAMKLCFSAPIFFFFGFAFGCSPSRGANE